MHRVYFNIYWRRQKSMLGQTAFYSNCHVMSATFVLKNVQFLLILLVRLCFNSMGMWEVLVHLSCKFNLETHAPNNRSTTNCGSGLYTIQSLLQPRGYYFYNVLISHDISKKWKTSATGHWLLISNEQNTPVWVSKADKGLWQLLNISREWVCSESCKELWEWTSRCVFGEGELLRGTMWGHGYSATTHHSDEDELLPCSSTPFCSTNTNKLTQDRPVKI